jgi:chemotaxis methyl-accepting protein methylase
MAGTIAPTAAPERAIDVEYPEVSQRIGDRAPLTVTSLFRENMFLTELLDETQRVHRKAAQLSIVSGGCSVGAEADSLLSLQNLSDDTRSVTMRGVDFNPEAIKWANSGVHWLPLGIYGDKEFDWAKSELQRMGFEVGSEPEYRLNEPWGEQGYLSVDTGQVRGGHDVRFIEHDMRLGMPVEVRADLALLNNVLYHLSPDGATSVLRGTTETLRKRGILSIGGVAHNTMPGSRVEYPAWLDRACRWLVTDLGLNKVNSIGDDDLKVFVKP